MQRTPHRCPKCAEPVLLHADMWGPYYVCDDCGWTCEDDASLVPAAARSSAVTAMTARDAEPSQRAGRYA